jgi:hypothetical protein
MQSYYPDQQIYHKLSFSKKAYVSTPKRAQHKLSLVVLAHELLI